MNRRVFLAALGAGAVARAASRSNIVLFLADDHGFFDSSVYGNKVVRTPNLQRLAAAGMAFDAAFSATPTCVPSRSVIMSGMMPARNGAERNHSGLAEGIKTLPTYMKALGYKTAHFGKSHFQPAANYTDMEFVPSEIKGGPLNADLDTAALSKWLDANKAEPLFLVVGCHSPHVYWTENEGYDPAAVDLPPTFVDTPETRRARTQYYSDVTKADRQLGEAYDACKRRLGSNTLFIYTSDNGAQWPFAKWSLYDAGIHLPFVATWPGTIRPGTRTAAMISFADLLPTFVELAGGKPPAGLDGRSFAGVLRGTAKEHRNEIFAAHSGDGNMNVFPTRCVRTRQYKYIRNIHPEFVYGTHIDRAGARDGKDYFDSWEAKAKTDPAAAAIVRRYKVHPAEELYDVLADPHEMRNLAGDPKHAAALRQLRSRLDAWMKEQGDEGRVYGEPRLVSSLQ